MTALSELAPIFSACGCWQIASASAMAKITPDLAKRGQELSDASSETHQKGTLAIQYTRDVATVLQGFHSGKSGLDLQTFGQIRELVEEKKARKALAIAREMDDMALDMAKKASQMTKTLMDSAHETLPANLRDEMLAENIGSNTTGDNNNRTRGSSSMDETNENNFACRDDTEASVLMELMDHADSDVEDVKTNTRSMEQVDIFTAGNTGRDAFFTVADKENVAVQIFKEISSVSRSIVETLTTGVGGNDSLCAQLFIGLTGIQSLFKALRLSKLIERALTMARNILEAFMRFIEMSWEKFTDFFGQFDAGKKLERFKNSLVGKVGKLGEKVFG